jgi:hypothetical protein
MAISGERHERHQEFQGARGSGQIAMRCNALAPMIAFHPEIIGLTRISGNADTGIVVVRIANGFAGHTSVLALFENTRGPRPGLQAKARDAPATGAASPLHHIALDLPFEDRDEANGIPDRVAHFGWLGWRGIFAQDPEGTTVDLVSRHPDPKTGRPLLLVPNTENPTPATGAPPAATVPPQTAALRISSR